MCLTSDKNDNQSDWIYDSGTEDHIANNIDWFDDYTEISSDIYVKDWFIPVNQLTPGLLLPSLSGRDVTFQFTSRPLINMAITFNCENRTAEDGPIYRRAHRCPWCLEVLSRRDAALRNMETCQQRDGRDMCGPIFDPSVAPPLKPKRGRRSRTHAPY